MTGSKELEKLGVLFGMVTDRSRSFLERCSETRVCAAFDPIRATNEYRDIALSTIDSDLEALREVQSLSGPLGEVRAALGSGPNDERYILALSSLRETFLKDVLRPAVRDFLKGAAGPDDRLESLYLSQLKIDSLLETARFLRRIQKK
ncbi:MAG: hypothetical protein HXY34_09120 [Candidatus Thorarchaeota archaeon]|nr:hypothetical protein [Candidatus Thorarchaeota archaeon]